MIPTYRSGTDSMHKSNQSGPNSKQQQQQQNNSSSFSANAPKADGKNAVNNESNQNQNQCNSPVKRRSISQIDVRYFSFYFHLRGSFYCVCPFFVCVTRINFTLNYTNRWPFHWFHINHFLKSSDQLMLLNTFQSEFWILIASIWFFFPHRRKRHMVDSAY